MNQPLPKAQRMRILDRDGWTCVICGDRGAVLEVDHAVPRFEGGLDEDENLQALCRGCHIQKTRRETERRLNTPQEVIAWRRFANSQLPDEAKL